MRKIFTFLFLIISLVSPQEIKEEQKQTTETEIKHQEQEYLLQYKFTLNEDINYSLYIENFGQISINEKYNEKTDRGKIIFNQKVVEVDENGNGILEIIYKQGVLNNENVSLSEKKAKLKMNPKGEIIESEGLQEVAGEFVKIVQKGVASHIPGVDRLPLTIDFSKMSSDTFNIHWESMRPVFPEKKLKIGESWERRIMVPIIYTMGNMKYTLENVEKNKAYIGMYLKKDNLVLKGKGIFDIEKGSLISDEFTINIKDINEKLNLKDYFGANVPPVLIQGKTKITVKMNLIQ